MIIYVNGDSYATASTGKRYSEFLSEKLNCPSINAAVEGSCNGRIIRTSLRDLIKLKQQHEKIVAVISLSFVLRTEVWNETVQKNIWKNSNDGGFGSYQFAAGTANWYSNKSLDHQVPSDLRVLAQEWLMNYNVEAETTNLLKDCILLTNWLQNNQISYVLFSGCVQEPVDFKAPFIKPFYDELMEDKHVIDFFTLSFTEWCLMQGHIPFDTYHQEIHGVVKNIGHHGELAHKQWADYLIDNHLNEI